MISLRDNSEIQSVRKICNDEASQHMTIIFLLIKEKAKLERTERRRRQRPVPYELIST